MHLVYVLSQQLVSVLFVAPCSPRKFQNLCNYYNCSNWHFTAEGSSGITLFKHMHGFNNCKATGIIKIARTLKTISSLFEFHVEWKNITEETADDITAVTQSS